MTARIVLVSGAPGTGKTTLAQQLSEKYRLPIICKDDYKEILYDALQVEGLEWSKKLSTASFDIVLATAKELVEAKQSFIIEGNFRQEYAQQALTEFGVDILEIYCKADPAILLERLIARDEAGGRHESHLFHGGWTLPKITKYSEIGVGKLVTVDTTNLDAIDYAEVDAQTKEFLK